jgi:methyltransferase (TIGR00027 family)
MSTQTETNLPLAATARWTASARSLESARDDCLFNDPWASLLAGPDGLAWLELHRNNVAPMVIRTHYFDGFLQTAAQQHGIRQVVIVAAGLDTRAYRLPWPAGTRLFELDQPGVLDYKERTLAEAGVQPACERRAIPVDLTGLWTAALTAAGYDVAEPSAWLLEGILFYLPDEAITQLLTQTSELAAPGSRLGCDLVNHLTLTSPLTHAWIDMQAREGAPWLGALDDPEGFLAGLGWQVSLSQPGAPDAHFGRWTLPILPVKMPNMPHNWYVTAEKPPA